MKKLFILSIPFLLCACGAPMATPYQPIINGEGYSDREIGKDEYEIQVRGNQITSYETLVMHFDRRASELCQGHNYDSSLRKKETTHISDGQVYSNSYYTTYNNGYNTTYQNNYYTTYVPPSLSKQAYVSGTVKCKMHRPKAGKK